LEFASGSYRLIITTFLLISTLSASTEAEKIDMIKQLIKQNGIDFVIEKTIPYEQKEYPKIKNKIETTTSVVYLKSTKTKLYKISVVNNWESIIVGNNNYTHKEVMLYYPQQMQNRSVNSLCSNKLNQLFFENGLKIKIVYHDEDGNYLFKVNVKNEDCKKRDLHTK